MKNLTELSPSERHAAVAGRFTELVAGVRDWDAPTPVKEWKASDVVDHLTGWLPGFLAAFAHVKIDEASETNDLREKWRVQTESVQAVLDGERAGELVTSEMFGELPLQVLIDRFYTADVFMHSWDLAAASGQDAGLDPSWAAELTAGLRAMGPALYASGQFGTPVAVPDDANDIDQLIGVIGRDPRWTPADQVASG